MDEIGDVVINYLQDISTKAELALTTYVSHVCPGEHEPKQHRDLQPPWCRFCGRDARGIIRSPEHS